MKKIIINGGKKLNGDVYISGMKNAALPVIFASIITGDVCRIENIPLVNDVTTSLEILKQIGAEVNFISETSVEIDTSAVKPCCSPYTLVNSLRGSTYLIGAELARFGEAKVSLPGGDDFGLRPLDQHFKGFNALGATVKTERGFVIASSENGLAGGSVFFDVASVGATINVMIAAVLAEGTTIIDNAAREPHIVDLASFLNTCGADISGAGTSVIKIRGVEKLHGCTYTIIPDMIEAGTYMAAVAATGGEINVHSVIPKHVETVSAKLIEMGAEVEEHGDYITVRSSGNLKHTSVKTLPYPGFPTDMHPQFTSLMCISSGASTVSETIWENRFKYVDELRKMGAMIFVDGRSATVIGSPNLTGAPVTAVDLRAGAALIIAGLYAHGQTEISNIEMIERGYYNIIGKLRGLGADIYLIS